MPPVYILYTLYTLFATLLRHPCTPGAERGPADPGGAQEGPRRDLPRHHLLRRQAGGWDGIGVHEWEEALLLLFLLFLLCCVVYNKWYIRVDRKLFLLFFLSL